MEIVVVLYIVGIALIMGCFKILMRYGWSYEREEADLVYGNHELYKKES